MITTNIPNSTSISAIKAKVDIYNGATLVETCTCSEDLQEFVLYREGDTSKFFGYGVGHKMTIKFMDMDRTLINKIQKGNILKVALGDGTNFDYPFPDLYITEVSRHEKTNDITCTAYDLLYKTNSLTVAELEISYPTTVVDLINHCAVKLGLAGLRVSVDSYNALFDNTIGEQLNFNGDEPMRVLLDALAEFTQSIYFVNNKNQLMFKSLHDKSSVLTVTKDMYYDLVTATPRTLTGLCHATELGDNLTTSDDSGAIQIMRDNPIYEMSPNIATLLDEAAARVHGFTITQLECEWDGNHCLEVGDKVAFVDEDDSLITTYILNDVIEFRGYLNEITSWEYNQEDSTAANPTNIGEKINQTLAKVDKVNKEITLLVSDVEDNIRSELSTLQMTSEEIKATVSSLETTTLTNVEALTYDVETLAKEVSLKVSSDNLAIVVQQTLSEGVDRVVTSAKEYTFDDNGLEISDPGSEISTLITEDGMKIYKNTTEVLTADNKGVKATDLHAVTYLLIGENSRLEDKNNRTACFWIGPAGG